jgi:transposase-like protein
MRARPVHGLLSQGERRLLQGLYTSGPAAFGSIKNLVKASGLSEEKVRQYLHASNAFTKFHVARRKFPRLRVNAKYINEIWCADLAHVDKLAPDNAQVKYLFVAIDVLSRFVQVQPMKTKTAESAKDAFVRMLSKATGKPKKLWTDNGTEFEGTFRRYCQQQEISIYHTFSETKAAYAERAIRSLKNIMYRYMEQQKTYKYLGKLQSFVQTMNSRVNRSTGMAPKDVKNADAIRIMYIRKPLPREKPKYKVDDYVRISRKDTAFRKGYKPQFTDEIFKIFKTLKTNPQTYTLKDKNNEIILGKFYETELILYTI